MKAAARRATPAAKTPAWTKVRQARNVFRVDAPMRPDKSWSHRVLVQSDQHFDSDHCDREMLLRHLREASESGCSVLSLGDFFDAMQGRHDKRGSKSAVMGEFNRDDYFDALCESAADFLAPFAGAFVFLGVGNHEDSVLKRNEVDLTNRLARRLQEVAGVPVHNGGFSGWVVYRFVPPKDAGLKAQAVKVHYDHGYGGGGAVTKDVIQHQRRQVYLPDADVVVSGHTHDCWVMESARLRLLEDGRVVQSPLTHLKCPTYKDDYGDGFSGWHATRGGPPKPKGAWWLTFSWCPRQRAVVWEASRAR